MDFVSSAVVVAVVDVRAWWAMRVLKWRRRREGGEIFVSSWCFNVLLVVMLVGIVVKEMNGIAERRSHKTVRDAFVLNHAPCTVVMVHLLIGCLCHSRSWTGITLYGIVPCKLYPSIPT